MFGGLGGHDACITKWNKNHPPPPNIDVTPHNMVLHHCRYVLVLRRDEVTARLSSLVVVTAGMHQTNCINMQSMHNYAYVRLTEMTQEQWSKGNFV